jgi:hypothetical protein
VAHLLGPAPEGAWTDPDRVVPTSRCATFRFRKGAWRRDWTVGNATFRAEELPGALQSELRAVTWYVQHELMDGVLCQVLDVGRLSLRAVAQREHLARITAPLPDLDPALLGAPYRKWIERSADVLLRSYGPSLRDVLDEQGGGDTPALVEQVVDRLAAAFDDLDRNVIVWRILHPEGDTLQRERLAHHLGTSVDLLRDREVGLLDKLRRALRLALKEVVGT